VISIDLRSRIASHQTSYDTFDEVLIEVKVAAQQANPSLSGRLISLLLAFMYVNCDIGRKRNDTRN
jgi:hypothetical protein